MQPQRRAHGAFFEMARILFASAPFGSFFRVIAKDLTDRGHQVWRIAWDGGDLAATPSRHRIAFRRRGSEYDSFIRETIIKRHITAVVTYNDTGERNRAAIQIAKQLGLSHYIVEQGYLRPHWITFDRDGVNGHSTLPKDRDFYHGNGNGNGQKIPQAFPCRMRSQVVATMRHFAMSLALYPFMPFDTEYYGDSVFLQAAGYTSEYVWRKTHDESKTVAQILARKGEGKKIFSVILQKPGDAQLRIHSSYGSNNPFLREVCEFFAEHAPADAILVVKQHPLDYGIEHTPDLFKCMLKDLNLEGRAYYLRKTSIDIVLDNADGFVLINSTTGVAAIQRGLPVKCCGKAIFDMEGLTCQGSLDAFWSAPPAPDMAAVNAFVEYLTKYSQVNGAIYAPKGIPLASRALCDLIARDFFSPHHTRATEKPATLDDGALAPVPVLSHA